jgi:hypothetical protein
MKTLDKVLAWRAVIKLVPTENGKELQKTSDLLTWFPPLLLLEGTTDLARKGQKVS